MRLPIALLGLCLGYFVSACSSGTAPAAATTAGLSSSNLSSLPLACSIVVTPSRVVVGHGVTVRLATINHAVSGTVEVAGQETSVSFGSQEIIHEFSFILEETGNHDVIGEVVAENGTSAQCRGLVVVTNEIISVDMTDAIDPSLFEEDDDDDSADTAADENSDGVAETDGEDADTDSEEEWIDEDTFSEKDVDEDDDDNEKTPEESDADIPTVIVMTHTATAVPSCDRDHGFVYSSDLEKCVCNELRGYVLPPPGYPVNDPRTNEPRCVQRPRAIGVTIQVGKVSDAGTEHVDRIELSFCHTLEGVVGARADEQDCFITNISDPSETYAVTDLDTGSSYDFWVNKNFGVPRGRRFEDLVYPDDFQYFALRPDPENPITDAVFISGLLLQFIPVEVEGEDRDTETFYLNPLVYRWIEDDGHYNYSPHSVQYDEVWGMYAGTRRFSSYDGTDSTVSLHIPYANDNRLSDEAIRWIESYEPGEAPRVDPDSLSSSVKIELHYDNYEDFGSDDLGTASYTSYGVTIFDGNHIYRRLRDAYSLRLEGDDDWMPSTVMVYRFFPGDREFLRNQSCAYNGATATAGFEGLGDNDGRSKEWPRQSNAQELDSMVCPTLGGITPGDGIVAFGVLQASSY